MARIPRDLLTIDDFQQFPESKTRLRPRQKAQLLKAGDVLSGESILSGFFLPVDEIFGWLDQD
jgi:hypothetical protein